MMSKTVRKEWEQYLFEGGRDYSLEETMEKAVKAIMFLKAKRIRVTPNMILDSKKYDLDFRLSESEKASYIQEFNREGYQIDDCATIVNVMDVIYHTFDVAKDDAFEMAKYAANNHLTVTKTIYDKLNVDFNETVEFINTVLPRLLDYFVKKTVKHGIELMDFINGVFDSLE